MKVEKAIEILTELSLPGSPDLEPDDFAAINLGIEGLRGIIKVRKTLEPYVTALLPGEDK